MSQLRLLVLTVLDVSSQGSQLRNGHAHRAETTLDDALDGFAAELEDEGYAEFLACFPEISHGRRMELAAYECIAGELKALVELLLLGGSVAPDALPIAIRRRLTDLEATGFVSSQPGGSVRSCGVVIRRVGRMWYACHPPQPDPTFYFGEDSLALLRRMDMRHVRNAVDLFSGPAIHALHCATFADHVTAVEVNADVAQLAVFNAHLNGLADRIEVLNSGSMECVSDQIFDVVIANPPSLPYPLDLPAPRVGHGGHDGRRHITDVLDILPRILSDEGVAHLVGMTTTDDSASDLVDWLTVKAQPCGLNITCTVISRYRIDADSDILRQLVSSVAAISGCAEPEVLHSYCSLLGQDQADHLVSFSLRVTRGSGRVSFLDVAHAPDVGMWRV